MPRCASASSAKTGGTACGWPMQQQAEKVVARLPAPEPRKLLAARLVGLGAIPIAVFCAVYLVASRFIGLATTEAQIWTLSLALAGSVASLFLLGGLAARTV